MTVKPGYVIRQGVIARNKLQTLYITQDKHGNVRCWQRNHDGTEYTEVAKP